MKRYEDMTEEQRKAIVEAATEVVEWWGGIRNIETRAETLRNAVCAARRVTWTANWNSVKRDGNEVFAVNGWKGPFSSGVCNAARLLADALNREEHKK